MDTDGENIWIGTTTGLYKYSIKMKSVVKKYNTETGKLTSDNVACLSFDKQKRLWIGTEGGGIDILNPATEQVEYLLPGEHRNAISSESVFAIFVDNESRKWIGTLKGGINLIDPLKKQFQTIAHDPLNQKSLVKASMHVADNLYGPWNLVGNPLIGPNADSTFGGQSTYVLPVQGKKDAFIFIADKWNPRDLKDSRYLWLPIEFKNGEPFIEWKDEWSLSFFTPNP